MIFGLVCKSRNEGGCIIRMRRSWRVAAAAAFFLFAAVAVYQVSTAVIVLMVVTALAALYREYWCFDPVTNTVVFQVGIAVLCRTRYRKLSDVQDVRLITTMPSGSGESGEETPVGIARRTGNLRLADILTRQLTRLAVFFADGSSMTIITENIRSAEQLRSLGQEIAESVKVRFREFEL